jgi:hypothetical protein
MRFWRALASWFRPAPRTFRQHLDEALEASPTALRIDAYERVLSSGRSAHQ